ncbi:MAG TPA: hypothetical protein VKG67_00010 [Gallionellaceae bacterium]|nr:hypothetical protein [Gallionellaceae bacterium]
MKFPFKMELQLVTVFVPTYFMMLIRTVFIPTCFMMLFRTAVLFRVAALLSSAAFFLMTAALLKMMTFFSWLLHYYNRGGSWGWVSYINAKGCAGLVHT